MSIRMSEDEIWDFVRAAHTGILTTLRADGAPISLPTWFVVVERTICLSTPVRARKLARVRRDPRAAFVVESGRAWAELRAVHLSGRVRPVEDGAARAGAQDLLDEKYAGFRVSPQRLPAAARSAYADRAILRLIPDERVLSWDNSRIRLAGDGPRPA